MSVILLRRKKALEDLIGHYAYLGEVQPDLGERFLAATEASFARLTEHPRGGALVSSDLPPLVGVRRWVIGGFQNYVILYRAYQDADLQGEVVEILRVIHGSRDLEAAFNEGGVSEALDDPSDE